MTDCYVTDIHICARDLQSAWWAPIGTLNFPFRFIKRINCSVQSQAMSDVCYIISFSSIYNSIIVVIIIIDRISKLCIFTTILTSIIYLVYAVQQWYHYKQLALILSGIFSQQVSVSVVDWWRVELRPRGVEADSAQYLLISYILTTYPVFVCYKNIPAPALASQPVLSCFFIAGTFRNLKKSSRGWPT